MNRIITIEAKTKRKMNAGAFTLLLTGLAQKPADSARRHTMSASIPTSHGMQRGRTMGDGES